MMIRGIVTAGILVLAGARTARAECVELPVSGLAVDLPDHRSPGWRIEAGVDSAGVRQDVLGHFTGRAPDVGIGLLREACVQGPVIGRPTMIVDTSSWSAVMAHDDGSETACMTRSTSGELFMWVAVPRRDLPDSLRREAQAIITAIGNAGATDRTRCPAPALSSPVPPIVPTPRPTSVAERPHTTEPPRGPAKLPFSMGLYLDAARAREPAALGGAETLLGAGLRARTVGAGSAELAAILGTTTDGGLRYDADVLLGYGGYLGGALQAAVLGGVGAGGITGDHVPFSFRLPVELVLGAHVSPTVHVETWARVAWVHADAREDGAASLDAADELTLGAALAVGRQGRVGLDRGGTAVYVAATYTEMMGTSVVGLAVGLGGVDRR